LVYVIFSHKFILVNHIISTHNGGQDTLADTNPVAGLSTSVIHPPATTPIPPRAQPSGLFLHPTEMDVEMIFASPSNFVSEDGPSSDLHNDAPSNQIEDEITALNELKEPSIERADDISTWNVIGTNRNGAGSLSDLLNSDAMMATNEEGELERENSHFSREPSTIKADQTGTPTFGGNESAILSRLNPLRGVDANQPRSASPPLSGPIIRPRTPSQEPSLLPNNGGEEMGDLMAAKTIVSRA
jgi:hypothetical protein